VLAGLAVPTVDPDDDVGTVVVGATAVDGESAVLLRPGGDEQPAAKTATRATRANRAISRWPPGGETPS
jgi:hypothetical protein